MINQKPGMKSPRSLFKEFTDRNECYIHNIELVHRYPIYGYHSERKPFLKIELYDTWNVKRVSGILQ